MELYTEDQISAKKDRILYKIEEGAVFVYPTDTVYGLGCDALNHDAVRRLRNLKETSNQLSVIAPNKEWIYENCEISKLAEKWINSLPGPFTLILPLKNKNSVSHEVTLGNDTIGVRLIDHRFQNFVRDFNKPIVTTSANRKNEEIMTHLERLDETIKNKVDMILYEGEKSGKASKIIDLINGERIIRE